MLLQSMPAECFMRGYGEQVKFGLRLGFSRHRRVPSRIFASRAVQAKSRTAWRAVSGTGVSVRGAGALGAGRSTGGISPRMGFGTRGMYFAPAMLAN